MERDKGRVHGPFPTSSDPLVTVVQPLPLPAAYAAAQREPVSLSGVWALWPARPDQEGGSPVQSKTTPR